MRMVTVMVCSGLTAPINVAPFKEFLWLLGSVWRFDDLGDGILVSSIGGCPA